MAERKPFIRLENKPVEAREEVGLAPVEESIEVPEAFELDGLEPAAGSAEVLHACFLEFCLTMANIGTYGVAIVAMLCMTFGFHTWVNRKRFKGKT